MANELSTKVAPEVLKGIVTDDTSMYTLAHHIDAARGLDAEYKVLTGQYNLKDDYYEEEDLDTKAESISERAAEICEELKEFLDRTTGIDGLEEARQKMEAGLEQYMDDGSGLDEMMEALVSICEMFEDSISEVRSVASARAKENDDRTEMIVAGSQSYAKLYVEIEEDISKSDFDDALKRAFESINGFVVQNIESQITSDDDERQSLIGGNNLLIEDEHYRYDVSFMANSDVPLDAACDLIGEYMENEFDDTISIYSFEMSPGQTARLGDVGMGEKQLFTAPKEVIESQKQYLLAKNGGTNTLPGPNKYEISIILFFTALDLGQIPDIAKTSDMDACIQYIDENTNLHIATKPYHRQVDAKYDYSTDSWTGTKKEISGDITEASKLCNGQAKYYTCDFLATSDEIISNDDLTSIILNAMDLHADYDGDTTVSDTNLNGILISINGKMNAPWGISYKTKCIEDYLSDVIWNNVPLNQGPVKDHINYNKNAILDDLIERFIDYLSMEIGSEQRYMESFDIDLDTVFNDLQNIINLKIKASPEYTQKLKDAQIRARRMYYFEPTLVPDADFEIIRKEN